MVKELPVYDNVRPLIPPERRPREKDKKDSPTDLDKVTIYFRAFSFLHGLNCNELHSESVLSSDSPLAEHQSVTASDETVEVVSFCYAERLPFQPWAAA